MYMATRVFFCVLSGRKAFIFWLKEQTMRRSLCESQR